MSIPENYQWHNYSNYMSESESHCVIMDNSGNAYVATSGKDSSNTARIIHKYKPDGTQVDGPNGQGTPWFINYEPNWNVSEFSMQKIILDENVGKLYVLYASKYSYMDAFTYFLACHNLTDGTKIWDVLIWESSSLRAGLDIDSTGNVFTVVEMKFISDPLRNPCLLLSKWSHIDGTEIDFSEIDGSVIPWGGLWTDSLKFIAFGIRKTDNVMYITFRYEPQNINLESSDLFIAQYDANFQLINWRNEYREFFAPDDQSQLCRPYYHDCYIDDDGSIIIGGYYSFSREIYDEHDYYGWRKYFYGIIVKFDSSLQPVYINSDLSNIWDWEGVDREERIEGRVKKGPGKNSTLFSLLPDYSEICLIDELGQKIGTKVLGLSIKHTIRDSVPPLQVPNGSNCMYRGVSDINDFTYRSERIIETGPAYLWKTPSIQVGRNCPNEITPSLVISYHHAIMPIPANIVSRDFTWLEVAAYLIAEKYPWIFPHWPEPRDPPMPWPQQDLKAQSSFSINWRPNSIPSYLININSSVYPLIYNLNNYSHLDQIAKQLVNMFKVVPDGLRFSTSMKKSIQKSLEKQNPFEDVSMLFESVNAIDLDWRVPSIPVKQVKHGKNIRVDFKGVAWISFNNVTKEGKCTLNIKEKIPSLAEGYKIGWPIASYNFDFEGKMQDYADVSIYIGGIKFLESNALPRILEWNGKYYKDVTTKYDESTKVLTGRTKNCSTYVIMNILPKNKKVNSIRKKIKKT